MSSRWTPALRRFFSYSSVPAAAPTSYKLLRLLLVRLQAFLPYSSDPIARINLAIERFLGFYFEMLRCCNAVLRLVSGLGTLWFGNHVLSHDCGCFGFQLRRFLFYFGEFILARLDVTFHFLSLSFPSTFFCARLCFMPSFVLSVCIYVSLSTSSLRLFSWPFSLLTCVPLVNHSLLSHLSDGPVWFLCQPESPRFV